MFMTETNLVRSMPDLLWSLRYICIEVVMDYEIEVTGTLSKEVADELRAELQGVQVVFSSGFTGERILKIIGAFTALQLDAVRTRLLRLLGHNQIGHIKITKDSIEIVNISAADLEAAKAAINELAPLIKDGTET